MSYRKITDATLVAAMLMAYVPGLAEEVLTARMPQALPAGEDVPQEDPAFGL